MNDSRETRRRLPPCRIALSRRPNRRPLEVHRQRPHACWQIRIL